MKLQNRQQLLAVIAVAAVAFFAGDKLLFSPLWVRWTQRSTQVTDLRKKINQGSALLTREQGVRRRWDDMRRNTLPPDPSVAEQQILHAFDLWAQESRISVTSITPQWKRDSDDYLSLECRVDAFGSLATVCRFLYEIEKDPLGLKLETVEISARDNAGQQMALGLQISGLVLTLPGQ